MKNIQITIIAFLCCSISYAQIIINELDSDTEGTDAIEFIELKSETPNFPLDGYIVVLFNGSNSGNDSSYFTLDLVGSKTDVNGVLLIGSSSVSPNPDLFIPSNIIQNGADAIAIYKAGPDEFPLYTRATTTNLIDALVYDTDDADDTGLMALLGMNIQINENENNNKDFESIQRKNDLSWEVKNPSPGRLNDGTGIIFNRISFSTDKPDYIEGETMVMTFTTTDNVDEDLNVDFSLSNGSFSTSDFTGTTNFTIAAGINSTNVSITFITDGVNDGDEFMKVRIGIVPDGFRVVRDNIDILVTDLDFTMAVWGNPLNPTYDKVQSSEAQGYYTNLSGKGGIELRQAMQNILADPDIVRSQTYADIINVLKEADQNPDHSNQVWLLYTEQGRRKIDFQVMGGSSVGLWNREHTYPQSRGGFGAIKYDDIADGRDVFVTTNADSLRHGFSDAHGLKAVDGPENSSRGNKDYGEYNGPTGNNGSWKGDAARAVMFMAVRYNNLTLVTGNPDDSTVGALGDLTTLLQWHRMDPPDDFEMNRNNVIYTWQFNRNPFIDRPDLVEYIFGNLQGQVYDPALGLDEAEFTDIFLYPNPTNGKVLITGLKQEIQLTLFTVTGMQVYQKTIAPNEIVDLQLSSGIYITVLNNETTSFVKRLIVE